MSLFVKYITQITPLENGNHKNCLGLTLFSQQMVIKNTKLDNLLGTPKGKLEMSLFFNYITQITPLEIGNHKIA